MKKYYDTPNGSVSGEELKGMRTSGNAYLRLHEGRPSRAVTRKIDWRATPFFWNTIVAIGKDLLVTKLSISETARKWGISRKTATRYKQRLLAQKA